MGGCSSTTGTSREGTWRAAIPALAAFAVVFQSLWLPAHLSAHAHLGDGHGHAAPASAGHGHAHHGHAHHGHDAHAPTTPSASSAADNHSPHEQHHPLTDHQPPAAATQAVSAPTLALVEARVRLPELRLLRELRARPPPRWPGDPPPRSFRSRAPPSV